MLKIYRHGWLPLNPARAARMTEKIEELLHVEFSDIDDARYPYVVAEQLEKRLDEKQTDECWSVYNSLDERTKMQPIIKLIEASPGISRREHC